MASIPAFPGPNRLGRSLVLAPGDAAPAPFDRLPRLRVDAATIAAPDQTLERLVRAWRGRHRVLIELDDSDDLLGSDPPIEGPAWQADPTALLTRERLRFAVWANAYDGRGRTPTWPLTADARRVAANLGIRVTRGTTSDLGGVDGAPLWVDGGPAEPLALPAGTRRVHRSALTARRWVDAPAAAPTPRDLDRRQRQIVAHRGGPMRVLAPAGSGKTRVLVARINRLVSGHGVPPEAITAVAFNVRAARELGARLGSSGVRVVTVHGLARQIVTRVAPETRIDLHAADALFDATLPGARETTAAFDDFRTAAHAGLSEVRRRLIDPRVVAARPGAIAELATIVARYRQALWTAGVLDFDELILLAIEFLTHRPQVREHLRRSTAFLLVDEMQDCTPAFVRLLSLLTGPAQECVVVGDDDQTIYRHAGADPSWLQDPGRWLVAPAHYALRTNYRCPRDVVRAADQLVRPITERPSRRVHAGSGRDHGLHVHYVAPAMRGRRLVELVQRRPRHGDVAVLARTNAQLVVAQVALAAAGLPRGAPLTLRTFRQPAFHAVLAWMRIALDPERIAAGDLGVAIRRPHRKLPPTIVPSRAHTSRRHLRRRITTLDRAVRPAMRRWLRDVDRLAAVATRSTTDELLAHVGVIVDPPGMPNGPVRRTATTEAREALAALAPFAPDPRAFERWLTTNLHVRASDTGVELATIHRVKGREWRHVVLDGIDDGAVPHRNAGNVDDERRILHVGLTRCRERVDVLAAAHAPSPWIGQFRVDTGAKRGDRFGDGGHRHHVHVARVDTGELVDL